MNLSVEVSATSQHTRRSRSCGISSTHKPLDTKSFRSFSFLTPYQDPILSAAQASCKLYPPPKMNLGKVQVYYIYIFPHMVSICGHIFLSADTRGSFAPGCSRRGIKNPPLFPHQSSVWALSKSHMLKDFIVNLT